MTAPIRRRVLPELAVAALFAVLSCAMTWPWAASVAHAVPDRGDPYLLSWVLAWDFHAAFRAPLHLFDANIFYPLRHSLAFSNDLLGVFLPLFWLPLLGLGPVAVYGVSALAGFAFTGYAVFRLARTVTGFPPGGDPRRPRVHVLAGAFPSPGPSAAAVGWLGGTAAGVGNSFLSLPDARPRILDGSVFRSQRADRRLLASSHPRSGRGRLRDPRARPRGRQTDAPARGRFLPPRVRRAAPLSDALRPRGARERVRTKRGRERTIGAPCRPTGSQSIPPFACTETS